MEGKMRWEVGRENEVGGWEGKWCIRAKAEEWG